MYIYVFTYICLYAYTGLHYCAYWSTLLCIFLLVPKIYIFEYTCVHTNTLLPSYAYF